MRYIGTWTCIAIGVANVWLQGYPEGVGERGWRTTS